MPTCPTTISAADFLPHPHDLKRLTLPLLIKAARKCRGCDLYCHATHVVFGEGPAHAPLIFIGEQPGDQEDQAGKPFVGPAGRLLDETLALAQIERSTVYVTNAVKHFKWTPDPRGKRRLHKHPNRTEVVACRPWLLEELKLLQPRVIVTLGATAAQSLLGPSFKLTQHRHEFLRTDFAPGAHLLATVHPSSLLRISDQAARHEAKALFLEDLKLVARKLKVRNEA